MILESKFPGKCNGCGTMYSAGDLVSWVKGTRGASHARCTDEGQAQLVAVQASKATDIVASDIEVPNPVGREYLPYQRAGVAYMAARQGSLLADEMGLGKTAQSIGVINVCEDVKSVLIICPASLKKNWDNELRMWLTGRANWTGGIVLNSKQTIDPTWNIVIVNYDLLNAHEVSLLARTWDLLIIDEAHYVKNPKAKRTKLVQKIGKSCKRRLALTGTPIANKPVELWPIIQLVDPENWDPPGMKKGVKVAAGEGAGFFKYAKRYCNAFQGEHGWDFSGASNLAELQHRLRATCMLRRLKTDVLKELPPKRRQVVELDHNDKSVAIACRDYEAAEAMIEELEAETQLALADSDEVYEKAVTKLKQKKKVAFEDMSRMRHEQAVAALPYAIDYIKEWLDGCEEKLIIFAHHKDVIAGLCEAFEEYGIACVDGETPTGDRQAIVNRFQSVLPGMPRVFIGSITAAGTGLTLTAASTVIFVEYDWRPGVITQAEDRAHRIGQLNFVNILHLVLSGSLNVNMLQRILDKQRVIDAALDDEHVDENGINRNAPALETAKQKEIRETALTLTQEDIEQVHFNLKRLAGMCDGANQRDGNGFNKIDQAIGHRLARSLILTPRQAALGQRITKKYWRQLQ